MKQNRNNDAINHQIMNTIDDKWFTIEHRGQEVVLIECSKEAKGEIVIPNGVTQIEEYAFCRIEGITSVVIPNSVTTIGIDAFSGCNNLTYVVLPDSVKSIGAGAFGDCSSLTSITIPQSVENIGECAFADCSGLTSIVVEPENKHFDSRNNCNAIIETAENMIIADCKNTIIPKGVTRICVRGYRDCIFEINQRDEDICLEGCPENISLSVGDTVTIPNTITSIAPSAFVLVDEVKTIIIPNSVKIIRDEAFLNCYDLESIIIPDSVTTIGKGVFSGCSKLKSIIVSSGNPIYDSRNSCNAIFETKSNTLIAGCSQSTIPDSIESIVEFAFEHIELPLFVVPESVRNIDNYAFLNSYGSVFVPEKLAKNKQDLFGDDDYNYGDDCKVCSYKRLL